ncbi:MAG: sulfite exporter TauE/SafE family protein [Gemmatimonadetes bacterium]|nr:sulfite exporter TauE/SafE family protein [Gemmatimonadota bacterium]
MDAALIVENAGLPAALSNHPATALPLVFLGGVLTSLTPCIYPMIPITAAVVGGAAAARTARGEPVRRWTPVAATAAYVVGMAAVYSALGLAAATTGTLFGAVSTNPWALLLMGNVLIVAALAMLEVVPVRVPAPLLQRAAGAGEAGRISGALVMGAMSGLVAAPCSAPVMAAVLTWVATTRRPVLGFVYLFVFSLGMSALLVGVGLSSGFAARLPRSGPWLVWVKRLFALLMLAAAEYYLVNAGQTLI